MMWRVGILTAILALLALPVRADEDSEAWRPGDGLSVEQFDLSKAKGFIEQLYRRGVEVLEDHVEFEGSFQPNEKGMRQGHLSLKLYPKGKRQSEDSLTAETWFGFSNKPDEDRLHFDFKFSKDRKPAVSPHDYI